MIGCFLLGGLFAFVALKVVRHRRYGCMHSHHGGRRFRGRFGDHHDEFGYDYRDDRYGEGMPFYVRFLSRRLYASPAQERVMADAIEQFRNDVLPLRAEAEKTRHDLAAAFRRPTFDEVQMGEMFARHDDAVEKLRKAVVGLGARVHEALDERQREQLATMIERGPGFRHAGRFGWGW
jgi:hypothetical protein